MRHPLVDRKGVAVTTRVRKGGPFAHDAVIEQDGALIYLGENAVLALDDKTLDARVADDGRVAFDIMPQVS